jgi:hypothetical protein
MIDPLSMLVALIALQRSGKNGAASKPQWPAYRGRGERTPGEDQPGGGTVPGGRKVPPPPGGGGAFAVTDPLPAGGGWKPYAPPPRAVVVRATALLDTLEPGQVVGPERDPTNDGREVAYRKERGLRGSVGVTAYVRTISGRRGAAPPPYERITDVGPVDPSTGV